MSRIEGAFATCRRENRAALVAYACAGDPDLESTVRLVPRLALAGADVVELGVPFSDPVADGPVIQAAAQRSLESGTTLSLVLDAVVAIRAAGCGVPIVLMSYLNPLLALGIASLCDRCRDPGVDGLIVVDLPFDEAGVLSRATEDAGIDLVLLAAPNTSSERLLQIGERSRGFLYFVTVTGVTGPRSYLPASLPQELARVRAASSVPVAAGFGISTPEQAHELSAHADGIVVGSAIVQAMREGGDDRAVELVRRLARALR
jgi:tryptophan synthase alpha chain